jgi:DNA helicase-2/ATP-dependent DNA helicase PcrA
MKERIKKHLPTAQLPFVGTFHSYCVRLLRQYAPLLPFQDFTILDSDDQRSMLKKIMQRHGLEKQITPSKMLGLISFDKNHLPEQKPEDRQYPSFFEEVRAAYEKEKALAHAYDFDDLLVETLKLLTDNPSVRTSWQERVRHLLVDEYQDTNQIQHALLKTFAMNSSQKLTLDSLCAVGDQDQSIYSWRGAQANNMALFAKEFAPVTTINIEQNYRSVQPILNAANAVITNNPKRIEKKLWSARPADGRIVSTYCQTGTQEAQLIMQTVSMSRQRVSLNDIAILYRTHHQSRLLEEALMHAGIAYTIIGGIRFYERKEIKDLLAYARLIANPFDRPSLLRIINTPTRGIGDKCINMLMDLWEQEPLLNCIQLLTKLYDDPNNGLNRNQRAGFGFLVNMFSTLPKQDTPSVQINHVITATGYRDFMRKSHEEPELTSRLENVTELQQAIEVFEQENPEGKLSDFLEQVVLMQEKANADDAAAEQVRLMTLHAAKGLEFDTVIISGLEEELFPSSRALQSSKELEEERRLMYVGITRAKEYLLLTHSQLRATYGSVTQQLPSRFLQEVPGSLITHHDVREASPILRAQTIAQWLDVTPKHHGSHGQELREVKTYAPKHRRLQTSSRPSPTGRQQVTRKRVPASGVTSKPVSHSTHGSTGSVLPHHLRRSKPNLPTPSSSPWKNRMPVAHTTFGVGIVQKVEEKGSDEWYLTISFKSGVKKLSSKFVRSV